MALGDVPGAPGGAGEWFHVVLSRAIARRQLTLDEIRAELLEADCRVSKATLSYWGSGQSVPSRPSSLGVIDELERILRLPLGQLRAALPSGAFSAWDPVVALPFDDQVGAALAAMGLPANPFDNHYDLFVQDSVRISADGLHHVEQSRQLVRSRVDGLSHMPIVFRHDFGLGDPPLVEAGRGCELMRVAEVDDASLVVLDFQLPRPLAKGELHMFDYTFSWDLQVAHEVSAFVRFQLQTIRLYSVDVSFEGELPQRISYRTSPHLVAGPEEDGDLVQELEVSRRVQLSMADAPAGKQAVVWHFD